MLYGQELKDPPLMRVHLNIVRQQESDLLLQARYIGRSVRRKFTDRINIFRHFFSSVPSEPPPEVPKDEPPDPNVDRLLSDSVRTARRNLVAVCGICLAWSTAQFALANPPIDVAGISIALKDTSIPLLLGILLVYLTVRWGFEFAMMPRHVRRWPLAQLDFRMVLIVARFSLLAITAGALDRSLWTVVRIVVALGLLTVVSAALSYVLIFVTMPIRMRARARANRVSAASAAFEAVSWAGLFAVCLTVLGIIGLGIASYRYEPLRSAIWPVPPDPIVLSFFVFTLIVVFLSHWLLRPVISRIFAKRPSYYTERGADGELLITFLTNEKLRTIGSVGTGHDAASCASLAACPA